MPDQHSRHLPHFTALNQPIFLTWRLHGSLPQSEAFSPATTGREFAAIDHKLDTATDGPLHLRNPEIAATVVEAIQHRDTTDYNLHRYVVMANHVHILITPRTPVSTLMRSLKRFTARQANRILCTTGYSFWQDESYDRMVRDTKEFSRIAHYIEMNPVRAGLVSTPEEFRWSSASKQAR